MDLIPVVNAIRELNDGWEVKGPLGMANVYHVSRGAKEDHGKIMLHPSGKIDAFGAGPINLNDPKVRRLLMTIWTVMGNNE